MAKWEFEIENPADLRDKNVWGPMEWQKIHLLAIRYPNNPSSDERRQALININGIARNLPCKTCTRHAQEYLLAHPPALKDTWAFQHWAWNFHNEVNARLGKPKLTCSDYFALYSNFIEPKYNQRGLSEVNTAVNSLRETYCFQ